MVFTCFLKWYFGKLGKHPESKLNGPQSLIQSHLEHCQGKECLSFLFNAHSRRTSNFLGCHCYPNLESSESIRKATLIGSLNHWVSMYTITIVQQMLTYCVSSPHSRRKSHFLRSYSYPNLESSESLRKATSNGSLRPRVSMLTMTVAQKMLTFCVSKPHSRWKSHLPRPWSGKARKAFGKQPRIAALSLKWICSPWQSHRRCLPFVFPSLTVVERAICLDHDPEKLGKDSESSLKWQPKPLSKYAHHDSRTEDAYLLCFHPSQSLKEPFSPLLLLP